jgi:hypothetical protein
VRFRGAFAGRQFQSSAPAIASHEGRFFADLQKTPSHEAAEKLVLQNRLRTKAPKSENSSNAFLRKRRNPKPSNLPSQEDLRGIRTTRTGKSRIEIAFRQLERLVADERHSTCRALTQTRKF